MKLRALNSLRRLLAAVVLVVWAVPSALELISHPVGSEPLIHIEAASDKHHADDCAANGLATQKYSDQSWVPIVAVLVEPAAEQPAFSVRAAESSPRIPATSRSPPRPAFG